MRQAVCVKTGMWEIPVRRAVWGGIVCKESRLRVALGRQPLALGLEMLGSVFARKGFILKHKRQRVSSVKQGLGVQGGSSKPVHLA